MLDAGPYGRFSTKTGAHETTVPLPRKLDETDYPVSQAKRDQCKRERTFEYFTDVVINSQLATRQRFQLLHVTLEHALEYMS